MENSYWSNEPATVSSMLNSNAQVDDIDTKCSVELLTHLVSRGFKPGRVLDVGAGIGRVSVNVLVNFFDRIDFLEKEEKFCSEIKLNLAESGKIGVIYNKSIQNFVFETKYDCIWAQWCLEYLTDEELVAFLGLAGEFLEKDGKIVVKENILMEKKRVVSQDGAEIRNIFDYKRFINEAELKIVKEFYHPNWPSDLEKVMVYVLRKA